MICKVSIHNFKCLRDLQVDLEQFTIFVGPNASGKSSVLLGLDLLCRAFRLEVPQTLDGEMRNSITKGVNDEIDLSCQAGDLGYRYRTRSPLLPPIPFHRPQTSQDGSGRSFAPSLNAAHWKPWPQKPNESAPLPFSSLLHLETSKLILPTPGPDPTIMSPDGTGLHSALASMALNDPDSWQALQTNLRQVIPSIRRLRHTKSAGMNQPPSLLFDAVGAESLKADQVSEGTLLVLGLLAAFYSPDRPRLVLLDDLDRGLHPKAQTELISLLRGLMNTNPDLQIVATTHSPYMLDSMKTNEVRMTFLGEHGATVCAALTSHHDFPKWKEEMTPGEMWSLFGEKWLVEMETSK